MLAPVRAASSEGAHLPAEAHSCLEYDIRQILEDAGATVLGPCGDLTDALRIVEQTRPHCAIVDVNLGNGPSFEPARALKARSIPFTLATGYDASVIPPEFANTPCLQKPTSADTLLTAVAKLCGTTRAIL